MSRERVVILLMLGNLFGAAVNLYVIFALEASTWPANILAAIACLLTAVWLWKDR